MSKFKVGKNRALAIGGASALLAIAATAGYAVADDGTDANRAEAPHSQVVVESNQSGVITLQENVVSVTKPAGTAGLYCVKPVDTVDFANTIPYATRVNSLGYVLALRGGGGCAADEYRVLTYNTNGTRTDAQFRLLVP